ncbi:MAG: PA2779 family protein, partial [Alphaproteobacteria bacterium]
MTFRKSCRILAVPVTILFALVSLPLGAAQAALVTTDEIIAGMSAGEDRARVQEFLDREDVRRHMMGLGVDPDEAARRIAGMSDEEIR